MTKHEDVVREALDHVNAGLSCRDEALAALDSLVAERDEAVAVLRDLRDRYAPSCDCETCKEAQPEWYAADAALSRLSNPKEPA